jgi:TetR/AcrR family transcriptional regulator
MSTSSKEPETLILDAARTVFIRNGYEGTSMQMIADEAGMNKALLHYYFRNKDRLFEAVFLEAFGKMAPKLQQIIISEKPFPEKIAIFVNEYITTLMEIPEIPIFILHELKRNPQRIVELVSRSGIDPAKIMALIGAEIQKGTIRQTDPYQLLVNMLAMCIFPFAARPIIEGFIFKNDTTQFETFMEKRKTDVTEFILNAIKK